MMVELNVGDRVKLSGKSGGWLPDNEGKTGTITQITHEWVYVTFDNSKGDRFEHDYGDSKFLELISHPSENPPATITHEGYTYTRGERVLPDWVKDGAFVVSKWNEEVYILESRHNNKFEVMALDGASNSGILEPGSVISAYNPFTAKDWKWGMWAMYEGKKVFVMGSALNDGTVFVSHSSFKCGWQIIPVARLTPAK